MTSPAPLRSPYPWLVALVWIGGALAVAWLRSPSTFLAAQFWAEDGSVFFTQADQMGVKALTLPHADYHHLAMRLWAGGLIALAAPVAWMPTLFVLGALLGWLAVAALVFSPRLDLRWRGALLLGLVMVSAIHEVWFNLTNLQWTLALLWPLWWSARDPATKWGLAGESLGMAVVGLTGVFSVVAAPFFLLRAGLRRSIASGIAAAVCVATAGVQLAVAWGATATTHAGAGRTWGVGDAIAVLGRRLTGLLFLPATAPAGVVVGSGVMVLTLILVWWGSRAWKDREVRRFGMWLAFGLAVTVAALGRFPESLKPLQGGFNGERYFWIGKVLLVWTVVQLAARETGGLRWVGIGALALALAVVLPRFRLPELPDNDWPTWAARIESGEDIGWVPITPEGMRFYYSGNPRRRQLMSE